MSVRGKHVCSLCNKRFERASEHMTHTALDHPEKIAHVPYAERWKNRIFTCGRCYKLMTTDADNEYIRVCTCGFTIDLRERRKTLFEEWRNEEESSK